MPELPDICVYIDALRARIEGRRLTGIALVSPFFLRTVEPGLDALTGRRVTGTQRLGKRIAIGLEGDAWLVIHLMVLGRLAWRDAPARDTRPTRTTLARLHFESGTLTVTESGSKKRASLHAVQGRDALSAHDPGGLEVLEADADAFAARLRSENRTLKRALTDPRLVSGIGNAYSDEILHRAGLSPVSLTRGLTDSQMAALFHATRDTLSMWLERLRDEARGGFPKKVTAFRDGMSVHGRYREPCPVCATPVQRIRYASNETNYCPRCQTGGKLLADRALSRLLKKDWPKTIDELERLQRD